MKRLRVIPFAVAVLAWRYLTDAFPWEWWSPAGRLLRDVDPEAYRALAWTYTGMLYTTPAVVLWKLWRTAELRMPRRVAEEQPRDDAPGLKIVLGRVAGRELVLEEKAQTRHILIFGEPGSGKTSSALLPILRQFVEHNAADAKRKLGGLILEVKGTMQPAVAAILKRAGREGDLVRIGLRDGWRYNPLHNQINPHSLASAIMNLFRAIYGSKISDEFWRAAPTALMTNLIHLFRMCEGYVTLRDLYRAVISDDIVMQMLFQLGNKLRGEEKLYSIGKDEYKRFKSIRSKFTMSSQHNVYVTAGTHQAYVVLEALRLKHLDSLRDKFPSSDNALVGRFWSEIKLPPGTDANNPERQEEYEHLQFYFTQDWFQMEERTKKNVKSSLSVYLQIFSQSLELRDTFCPPKSAYVQPQLGSRPIIESFDELIEKGKICFMDMPATVDQPASRLMAILAKMNFWDALLRRLEKVGSKAEMRRCFAVFDEWQDIVSAGAGFGDEHAQALLREALCTIVAATQSISAIDSVIGEEARKTLVGLFANRIIFRCSDVDTVKWATEICGDSWEAVKSYSLSEHGRDSHALVGGPSVSDEKGVGFSESSHWTRIKHFYDSDFYELPDFTAVCRVNTGTTTGPAVRCRMEPIHL